MAWFLSEGLRIDAIVELNKESPRAAAIVGAAILENQLTRTVKSLFNEGSTKDGLFKSPSGKLSDFDIKAKLAYTLGLISKDAFRDVTAVGDVRNNFAHRLEIDSFRHEAILPVCMGLRLIDKHMFPIEDGESPVHEDSKYYEADLAEKLLDPRQRFMMTVRVITSDLFFRTGAPPHPKNPGRRVMI